jgi:hypothetical protein
LPLHAQTVVGHHVKEVQLLDPETPRQRYDVRQLDDVLPHHHCAETDLWKCTTHPRAPRNQSAHILQQHVEIGAVANRLERLLRRPIDGDDDHGDAAVDDGVDDPICHEQSVGVETQFRHLIPRGDLQDLGEIRRHEGLAAERQHQRLRVRQEASSDRLEDVRGYIDRLRTEHARKAEVAHSAANVALVRDVDLEMHEAAARIENVVFHEELVKFLDPRDRT